MVQGQAKNEQKSVHFNCQQNECNSVFVAPYLGAYLGQG